MRTLMERYPVTAAFILGCLSIALFVMVFHLVDLEDGRFETSAPEADEPVKAAPAEKRSQRATHAR